MSGKGKGRAKGQNNIIYAHALPIVPVISTSLSSRILSGALGPSFRRVTIENPNCVGIYDNLTKSVWVINARDTQILWRRGFFGKGNLSRSEPSWLTRRLNELKGMSAPTAEEVTAQRRAERQRFKFEREKAMTAAAAEAEAAFRSQGKLPAPPVEHISTAVRANLAAQKRASTTSGKDNQTSIHPKATTSTSTDLETSHEVLAENEVENMEHLQLTLQEAWFLAWGLGCLSVLDPSTDVYMSRERLWHKCLHASLGGPTDSLQIPSLDRFDNPFLIKYATYHHFRSLGWVVKTGIKFCVDYLLYKRGPVFSHAEFAIVVCPVYEDPSDEATSPFQLPNTKPFSWSWLSTLNRVNTQVRKTLIIVYVTIPAMKRLSTRALSSPAVLEEYTVNEVVVKRFVPARMRD